MSNVEIRIKLPKYLVDWLIEFSKETGNSLDDFITSILHRYYDAWKIGRDSVLIKIKELNIDLFAEEFIKMYKKYRSSHIVRHFAVWIKERGLNTRDLDEDVIKEFLTRYTSSRNIKKSSLQCYKYMLNKFVEFIKEKSHLA